MIQVGVDLLVDETLLKDFPADVKIVRIPEDPREMIAVDFWVPAMQTTTVQRQWVHLRGVKVVQLLWAGVDTLLGLFPSDVILCDARGVHDIPVAEWTLTAILAMQKRLPVYFQAQEHAEWTAGLVATHQPELAHAKIRNIPPLVVEINAATVLIVGYGAIGQAIEARLAPFGARFLRIAHHARQGIYPVTQLDELLPAADIVVLTAPLTAVTRHLIDARRMEKMKTGALLVNAARGPIVETQALLKALHEGRLRAALDVVDPEPLPANHPLWRAPNLLLTPHIAGESAHFMRRAFLLVRQQVERFIHAEPLLNVVTGEY